MLPASPVLKRLLILKTGERLETTFTGTNSEFLIFTGSDSRDARVLRREVRRVEASSDDGVANGVLLGVAIGFAGPAIVTFASGVDKTEYPLGLGIGVIGAAVGGIIGWRLDKSNRGNELLYEASLNDKRSVREWNVGRLEMKAKKMRRCLDFDARE